MSELEERINRDINKNLSDKRYSHTIGVRDMTIKLCERWDGNVEKGIIAALLHDSEKERPISELRKITGDSTSPDKVLHGFAASITAKEKYGISDNEILDAIAYHTTGRGNMTLLDKIIFVADLVEETRSYSGVEEIRQLAFDNLDKAVYEKINFAIYKCERDNLPVHSLTLQAKEYIISELNEQDRRDI